MQKKYRSYINKRILHLLLNGEELKRGRKIIGYGHNLSYFDNVDYEIIDGLKMPVRPTRRIFSDRREDFFNLRLITKIDLKNDRDKYYSITPLGICDLIQDSHFIEKLTNKQLHQIWIILDAFANSTNVKSIFNLKDESEEISRFLKNLKIQEFKLLPRDVVRINSDSIDLFLPLPDGVNLKIASIFTKNQLLIRESYGFHRIIDRSITEEELLAYVANFLIFWIIFGAAFYDFREQYIYKKSPIFNMHKYLEPSILQKLNKIKFVQHNQIMSVNLFEEYLKHLSEGKMIENTLIFSTPNYFL